MSQGKDVVQFLEDNEIELVHEVTCPMPTREAMLRNDTPLSDEGKKVFRKLVGSLRVSCS